ncbi:multidrug ABC transporter permease [Paenibacillus montaniterrae]|uniref:Transport permease protein n=1 Tax=Paenibacillus montaniterrae TaxID=429341 RepID=A0A919YYA8_9BACL|nr:ABC transporter permease [Paenibacillus montaniterrae]GIP19376.1 multidrug ABC transporter permease [Paenibacillus montaniterrae]
MKLLTDTGWVFMRYLRGLLRSPFILVMTVVQPIFWMILFGHVFSSIGSIPGFAASSYIDYLGPGIVMMSTMMSGAYSGMGVLSDYKDGVLDRMLISPINRLAMLLGSLLQDALTLIIQAALMVGVASLLGASFSGGLLSIVQLILIAVLLGLAMGALSISLGLIVRKESSLTAAVSFATMPLLFLSGLFMPLQLVPRWVELIARFNPLNWAVEAGREVLGAQPDWSLVLQHGSYLLILFAAACLLVFAAFRQYQRSL